MPLLDPTKHTFELLDLKYNDLAFMEQNYFLGFRRLGELGLLNILQQLPTSLLMLMYL